MGNVLVNEESLQAIADAIRVKNGSTDKYLPSEMPSAIEGIQSGGEDYLECVWNATLNPSGFTTEKIVLNVTNAYSLNNLWYANNSSKKNEYVKHIVLNCSSKVTGMKYAFSSAYNRDSILEKITLNVDTSSCVDFMRPFGYLFALKTIDGNPLDLRSATNVTNIFQECSALEEVRFVEGTIPMNISFLSSPNLSDATRQSIIDGLATVETAQTLTFHATVKAKLTEEQIAQITAKNWTLA